MSDSTDFIEAAQAGDLKAAADLLPLVYDELRQLAAAKMAGEPSGHTLDATALVHEAYLRLVNQPEAQARPFADRSHFFAAAAEAMRRILVDRARKKRAEDAAAADVARLRLFVGLSVEEAAEALGVSRATAFRDWAYARAWIAAKLGGPGISKNS
jgi:DNA-directed RNA polymerase specialized sigma24 family protein